MSYFAGLSKSSGFQIIDHPVVLPFKSLIQIEKASTTPVFVQLSNQLGQLIREGKLQSGQRLPGTRQLAELLQLNRQTIVAAYDEGLAQGWLESRAGSGTYVADHFPEVKPQPLADKVAKLPGNDVSESIKIQPGYTFESLPVLHRPLLKQTSGLHLDDGFPDIRLAPMDELSRAYRSYFRWGNPQSHFGYSDTKGHVLLREQLSLHLNETRGLSTTLDNILITRGSIMGLHLASQVLLRPGDVVVTGETTWLGATMNFQKAGATLATVPVDQYGIDVDALAQLCAQKKPIRMVFVTPHHHYPTTVTLRPDRRIRLLQLADQYGFIVLEDDYDYDFHYLSRPILPFASADPKGMVVYIGSLTKSVAPAFRVGYVVAPTALIDELARLRRIIDRQGDPMLEFAIGQLFKTGDLKRHFRKSLRTYHARRDCFCDLLTHELGTIIQFTKPDGGMAVWARFDPSIDMESLVLRAEQNGLFFSNGLSHNPPGQRLNSTRFGFASSTEDELERSVAVLKKVL